MIRRFFTGSQLFFGERLQLNGIGIRERMPPGFVNRPKGTGDFLIMYFHTKARVGVSPEAPEAAPSTLFIWPPGEAQHYGNSARHYLHSWMHCDGALVKRILKVNAIPLSQHLALPSARTFLRFLTEMYREIALQHFPDESIAKNLFENWALDLSRLLKARAPVIPERLRRVQAHIDTHHSEPMALETLAAMANWSPSHFSAQFRHHFGIPPINYVIQSRMQHAVYLLQDSRLTITEIARRTGHEDLFYFSKLFKKVHRMSPRAMRERLAHR